MINFIAAGSSKIVSRPRTRLVALIPFLVALTGCEAGTAVVEAIEDTFVVTPDMPIDPGAGEPANGCFVQRFRQPDAIITRKLDVLFVIDTSGSIVDERAQIAEGIDAFINALPAEVDYRIAVMLAHGSHSTRMGKLYKKGSEPVVLASDALTVAQIKAHLRTKMENAATDNYTDGGEAGLASLNRGLDDDRVADAKAAGFYRADAALSVIFVADENDICAVFPSGVTPVVDHDGWENSAPATECHRSAPAHIVDGVVVTPAHNEDISSELVLAKLRAFKGDLPLVIGGVLYDDPATTPPGGENEVGYGYIDVVNAHNGVVVNMASGSYGDGLSRIGTLASVKMNLALDFGLTNNDVDADTIVARVDGQEIEHSFDETLNTVHLASGGVAGSFVDISYCEMEEEVPIPSGGADAMCRAGAFVAKASINVGISIDAAEGAMPTIMSGLASIGVVPTVYSDAQIAAGQPTADGKTVMIISRKAVLTGLSQAYVDGVRSFIQHGGSVLGEYDGAAMMFRDFDQVNSAFQGHFDPSLELFDGGTRGGGLVLPVTASTMNIIDSSDPIMAGQSDAVVSSGLRWAFAIESFDSTWLHTSATFTSVGYANLVPAGTFPAVMKGRCGSGRVVLFTMNHLQAIPTSTDVAVIVHNAFQWLVGNTN